MKAGYRELGRFGVLVHPDGEIVNGEWDALFLQMQEHLPVLRTMIVWSEGRLNATQRTAIAALYKEHVFRIVAFTDSAQTRGAMTALEWLGIPVAVLAKSEFASALVKLGLTTDELSHLRSAIRQMEHGLTWRVSAVRQKVTKPSKVNLG
jgi:hypothetical protein